MRKKNVELFVITRQFFDLVTMGETKEREREAGEFLTREDNCMEG